MARFTNLQPATQYDITGPDGQFISRNMSGAAIMAPESSCADRWPTGSCAWLTQCPDGADDTEPADAAA